MNSVEWGVGRHLRVLFAALAATLLTAVWPGAAIAGQSRIRVRVIQTTASLDQALARMPDRHFGPVVPTGVPILRVNDGVRFQRVTGFGAAMTDSSAWLIYDELGPAARAALLNSLFSTHGIDLSFVRVPIGASDFTATGRPYSYDELAPGQVDPQLADFTIAHDDAYIIPALRQMLAINPHVDILASMWSAPTWMKANHAFDNLHGFGALEPYAYQPLAAYFVKFIKAYASRGVPISAITPQNEPHARPPYPGGELPAAAEAQWISQGLDPALVAARLHPEVYGGDSGNFLAYAQDLLASPASSSLSGIAWHCYGGPHVMSQLHGADPRVDQFVSECSPGIIPYPVSEVLISSVRNWASAVELWNLALDPAGGPVEPPNAGCFGCTGVATISEQTQSAALGINYYQLGQMSKYVQPGAYRVSSGRGVRDYHTSTGSYGVTSGLDNAAFVNPDNSKVLVAYDNSTEPIRFAVKWAGSVFTYTLAPRATVTFVWK